MFGEAVRIMRLMTAERKVSSDGVVTMEEGE